MCKETGVWKRSNFPRPSERGCGAPIQEGADSLTHREQRPQGADLLDPPEDRATHMFYKHRRFLRWEPFPPVSFYSARTSIPALSGTRFASRLSAPSNSLIHSYTAAQEVAPCKCARSPASESRSGSSLSSEKAAGGR